jgi:hypothetical protein
MRSNKFIKVAAESSKCPKTDAGTRAANLPSETGYALENAGAQAGDRFIALSALFDAGTIRHLEDCGVSSGWHCLELGGGRRWRIYRCVAEPTGWLTRPRVFGLHPNSNGVRSRSFKKQAGGCH